jgi:hypothetical protein
MTFASSKLFPLPKDFPKENHHFEFYICRSLLFLMFLRNVVFGVAWL